MRVLSTLCIVDMMSVLSTLCIVHNIICNAYELTGDDAPVVHLTFVVQILL